MDKLIFMESCIPCRQSHRSWHFVTLELLDFSLAADFGSQSLPSAQQLRQPFHVPSKPHWLMKKTGTQLRQQPGENTSNHRGGVVPLSVHFSRKYLSSFCFVCVTVPGGSLLKDKLISFRRF